MTARSSIAIYMSWLILSALPSCGDDVYEACEVPEDCSAPEGRAPACVYKSGGGFCSWLCSTDSHCAVDDEFVYVCAPFESNPDNYCFPSCEQGQACPEEYECRSTGGGSENRKLCFPL